MPPTLARTGMPRVLTCLSGAVVAASLLAGCGGDASGGSSTSSTGSSTSSGTSPAAASAICGGKVVVSETDTTRTIATAFGNVEIPTSPQRVIGLEGGTGPALESGIVPVGISDDSAESYRPAEYAQIKDKPVVLTPDGWDYDKLSSLKPDLMIGFVRGGTEETLSQDKVQEWKKMSALAPTVLIRSDGSGQTKDTSCALQVALGRADTAKASKTAYEKKAAAIKKTYAKVLAANTFVALDAYDGEVTAYSPISWIGDILTDAGAPILPLAAKETKQNGVFLSTEQLRQVDDATVVLYSQTVDSKPDLGAVDLQKAPTYRELAAVKAGHAYGLPYFFADRYTTGLLTLQAFEKVLQDLDR